MTEDGRWFLNLNDTSYFLLCTHDALGGAVSGADFQDYVKDSATELPAFWKTRLEHMEEAVRTLKKGTMHILTQTPGGRNVYLVSFGDADDRGGSANGNSAVGGRDPFSFAQKDGTQKPVVFLLGPVHGQEVEGIAGLLNLLQVAETGRDLRSRQWEELATNLAKCRVLIVPCGSPDARARCPFESWVGVDDQGNNKRTR